MNVKFCILFQIIDNLQIPYPPSMEVRSVSRVERLGLAGL